MYDFRSYLKYWELGPSLHIECLLPKKKGAPIVNNFIYP